MTDITQQTFQMTRPGFLGGNKSNSNYKKTPSGLSRRPDTPNPRNDRGRRPQRP